jgi:hypothetical protein
VSDPVAIQSTPEGYTARVNSDGQISTETEVTNTVDTQPAAGSVTRTSVSVGTTSGTLVAALPGRRGIWIQVGAFPIYLRFAAAAATTADWLVPAGGEFRQERFPYAGEVRAIAVGGTSVTLVLEMGS